MNDFVDGERLRASAWKTATETLPGSAREPAAYIGKDGKPSGRPLQYCLPPEFADHNLLPEVRRDALTLFAELDIPWHAGVNGGPSNHLLSSQVQCVNALGAMVSDADRIRRAFSEVVDVAEVLPIEPGRYLTFEFIGEHDYLKESRSGSRTRGSMCTSVDAAFLYKTSGGVIELALIEWKYTESYKPSPAASPRKNRERARRYEALYLAPDGPLHPLVDFETMLHEPFYQLMRQQLLAHELERHGELGAERVRLLHVLDPSNEAYQASLPSQDLAAHGETVDEVWAKALRQPDRFLHVNPAIFRGQLVTSPEYVRRYG